jgi:hypothetical protein
VTPVKAPREKNKKKQKKKKKKKEKKMKRTTNDGWSASPCVPHVATPR